MFFRLTNDWNHAIGTSLKDYVTLRYKDIVQVFGEPTEVDEFKVSGEWIFINDETGECFTIYDWKSTNLYDPRAQSVDQFRSSSLPFKFNVGGKTDASTFISWVKRRIQDYYTDKAIEQTILK